VTKLFKKLDSFKLPYDADCSLLASRRGEEFHLQTILEPWKKGVFAEKLYTLMYRHNIPILAQK
jgi:hypothetical protein